jgi:PleD family two-component response regulator
MTPPLALVLYEKLLPGSQLANRLQDLNWRVQVVSEANGLAAAAEQHKPLLVFADLVSSRKNVESAISKLRQNEATKHVPVIAFTAEQDQNVFDSAIKAGATLVANDTAILQHLGQFIEQALSEF